MSEVRATYALAAIDAARAMLETPWQHQGRLPGVALDCVGLLICAARQIGYVASDFDINGYGRQPDGVALERYLREHLDPVAQPDMRPGDVVCVAFSRQPQHVGILGHYRHGGLSIIHAAGVVDPPRVVETRLLLGRLMQFRSAWRWREAAAEGQGV